MKKYARIVMKSFVNCPRFKKPMDYFTKILNLYGCVRSAVKKKSPFSPLLKKCQVPFIVFIQGSLMREAIS